MRHKVLEMKALLSHNTKGKFNPRLQLSVLVINYNNNLGKPYY